MKVGGYRPANSWLRRQLDRRWQRWLVFCFAGAVVVSVLMTAFIAPRQSTLRMRYEIAQLSHVADQLEREQRHLLLERESLASPTALAADLEALGLVLLEPSKVTFLTPAGDLVLPAARPTPQPPRVRLPRRGH
ncbi:MAG: hypothetical protein LAO05_05840 [Acidobacteriia bacterium]|nr:hypothetical protein [Terriglobia bacterium]